MAKMAKPEKQAQEEQDVFSLLEQINALKQPTIDKLLAERKELDRKLAMLGYLPSVTPKSAPGKAKPDGAAPSGRTCKTCGLTGHNARTCPNKPAPATT